MGAGVCDADGGRLVGSAEVTGRAADTGRAAVAGRVSRRLFLNAMEDDGGVPEGPGGLVCGLCVGVCADCRLAMRHIVLCSLAVQQVAVHVDCGYRA